MPKYDVITVGGATEDIAFLSTAGRVVEKPGDLLCPKLLAFPYGAKMEVERFYENYGGGAANTAVNLAGLGLKVAALTRVGKDEHGLKVAANLRAKKVKTDLLQFDSHSGTSFSFIIIGGERRERLIFSHRGANHNLIIGTKELSALRRSSYIYLSSLSGANWRKNLGSVFGVNGVKIVWNPGEAQLHAGADKLAPYLKKTYLFCLNKDEALELVRGSRRFKRAPKSSLKNIRHLLSILKEYGPEVVVITDGANGAHAYDGQKYYRQGIIRSHPLVDTTGVGDAFHSTLLFGLKKYDDLEKAMKLGMYNTAALVKSIGAQNGLLNKNDLPRIKI